MDVHTRTRLPIVHLAAVIAAVTALGSFGTEARSGAAPAAGIAVTPVYAITGARIVTVSGAPIDKGTVVMRNGLIDAVGADVTAPADAVIVDGTGLTVYPGLIDMANSAVLEMPAPAAAPAPAPTAGRGGGRGGGQGNTQTWEDLERVKRALILHPDLIAAEYLRGEGPELTRLASAGITTALAVPPAGTFRGQSALVNVLAPPDDPEISTIADYRKGLTVVRSPVALHVGFNAGQGGGRGGGYPGSLLGYIAFVRQAFDDAKWQQEARAWAGRHTDAPRQVFEPALDAIAPALDRRLPVAFDAGSEREILRALAMAKEFNLDPIIVGGDEAAAVVADLKTAGARVIYTLNFPQAGGGGGRGGGGRGGGGGAETLAQVRARVNAPRGPAALEQAGVPYAFTSGGLQSEADFVRNAGRTVKEGNLPHDAALRALTLNAAKMAGADDRLGSIDAGKIANLVVTEGELLDGGRIRHVFIDGRPVTIDTTPAQQGGRGGRGGGR
jgi:imidazolonepropionase-like amidohydrolase